MTICRIAVTGSWGEEGVGTTVKGYTYTLEIRSGDGPTGLQVSLLMLNCTLKNDQRNGFYDFQWNIKK